MDYVTFFAAVLIYIHCRSLLDVTVLLLCFGVKTAYLQVSNTVICSIKKWNFRVNLSLTFLEPEI